MGMALRQQSSGKQRPQVFWKESDLLAHNYPHIKQEEVKGKEREMGIKQGLNSSYIFFSNTSEFSHFTYIV